MVREAGASEVLGIDLSYHNIRLAENIEDTYSLGIQYVSADVFLNDVHGNVPKEYIGNTDIVVGYFAFDHAMNKSELNMLAINTKALLKQGGVFIGMADCPSGEVSLSSKYGVGLNFDEKNETQDEGKPRRVSIYRDNMEVTHFHNFVWKQDTVRDALTTAGFSNINIAPATVSDFAKASCGGDFWKEYETAPDQVVIEAKG